MYRKIISVLFIAIPLINNAQNIDRIINAKEVERIEKTLSADDMQGRKTFTPGIDKAADFIASEFAKNKLKYWGNNKNYFQEIVMVKTKANSVTGNLDLETLNANNVIANTTQKEITINNINEYNIITVSSEENFNKKIFPIFDSEKNSIILIDSFHLNSFSRMKRFASNAKFATNVSQILILTSNLKPTTLQLHIVNESTEQKLKNVIGVIPGGAKKDEFVIFSCHYDHLGIGKSNTEMDSIYNGANDDAAGTAAVIMLSNYFNAIKTNNERTILFVAFTAEEIGGFGSRFFSKQLDPDKVVAMFNIEMIGTESKWGKNSAYITGFEKSSMGQILQKNLLNTNFKFEPDPYPKQNLFYRSDNATLAALGVPAHTISTSKMDTEKYYHTQDDEIETLDMNNMAEIIKAIALSSKTIISGIDTPTRVIKEK